MKEEVEQVGEKIFLHDKTMDKRIIDNKLRTGEITKEQMKKYLEELPDASDNMEEIFIEIERKRENR